MKIFVICICLLLTLLAKLEAKQQTLPPLHHPVGIRLPATMQAPTGFPLGKQQQLICKTCHGIRNLAQIPLTQVNSKAKNFLRNGPYANLLDFCKNCHQSRLKQKNMQRFNVHQMLDQQGRRLTKNCTYCHVDVPNLNRYQVPLKDWRKLRFQLPVEKLCYGCHLKTTHLNAVQHQVKPSRKVLQQMHRSETQKHIILPLDNQGKMMCVTCHSPHQHGVLSKNKSVKALGQIQYGKANYWSRVFAEDKKQRWQQIGKAKQGLKAPQYRPIKQEILLRLPAKNGELCRACHLFKD